MIKEAVDQFWIDVSGSKERARFLIKKYFIQECKMPIVFYFISRRMMETGQGMIYLILVHPKTVYRTSDTEYWDYGFLKDMEV